MPFAENVEAIEAADVPLAHLGDYPLSAITIPSKTQYYLSSGRPILMAVRGDAADLVERVQVGIRCNAKDPTSIADAAIRCPPLPASEQADMGERDRPLYEKHPSIELAVEQFEANLFASMSNSGTARRARRQARTQRSRFLATIRRRRGLPEEM